MKLWKLDNPDAKRGHCAGFVIAAPSARAARKMAQERGGEEIFGATWTRHCRPRPREAFWTDPKRSTCTLLAADGRIEEAGIVLAGHIGD